MNTKLIELKEGILVEVDVDENNVQQISCGVAEKVDSSLDKIKPLLLKACRPIVSIWDELNKDLLIDQAEIELALSFEGEGNIYITKAKAASNFKVKLILKPPVK